MNYIRINKQHIQEYISQPVTIVGKPIGIIGNRITVDTGNNEMIIIESSQSFPSDNACLEIQGIVTNNHTILCHQIQLFGEQNFDLLAYKQAVNFYQNTRQYNYA